MGWSVDQPFFIAHHHGQYANRVAEATKKKRLESFASRHKARRVREKRKDYVNPNGDQDIQPFVQANDLQNTGKD